MKARLCISTVDGAIFRSAYEESIFSNKEKIAHTFREMKNLTYMSIIVDGVEMYFNPDNIVSFWMEDDK